MSTKLSSRLSKIPLDWRYRIGVIAVILLAMLFLQVLVDKPEYASDKHSALVNLGVLLFTVLIVDTLTSAKTAIAVRQGDEQRILGFHQMLSVYLARYQQAADAMTRPMDSYVAGSSFKRRLQDIAFPDMENMYNVSLDKHVPMNTKCYTLYFNAATELGDVISQGLAYVYSAHHTEVAEILIALATNNNHLDTQALHEGFKSKERSTVGGKPLVAHDIEFLQGIRSGDIPQTVDFIEANSHGLSSYARVYKLLMANLALIEMYKAAVEGIRKK